jgi:maleate isomerase
MPDALGWRGKFGVMAPSTNTIVQPDFDDMRPFGVTNHYSRIFTPNAKALSNDSFKAGIDTIGSNVMEAIRSVMTCEPDYLVMGISALSFFGGAKGAEIFAKRIVDETSASPSAAKPPPPLSPRSAASSALLSSRPTGRS